MKKVAVILLVVCFMLSFSATSFAAAQKGAATKLDRGLKNVALGWTEIPKAITDTTKNKNVLVGLTVGTIKGILNAFSRTVSGTVDVATFTAGTYEKPAIKPIMTGGSAAATTGK